MLRPGAATTGLNGSACSSIDQPQLLYPNVPVRPRGWKQKNCLPDEISNITWPVWPFHKESPR